MARTITGGQRTQLASRRAAHFLRVQVQNAAAVWTDLRTVGGADYQLSATVSSALDTPATTAAVVLRAGRSFASIAPGMTGATPNAGGRLLDVGRGLRIDVAVLAPGTSPALESDWTRLFDGRIDTVEQSGGGDRITLRARDRMVPILDAMFLQNETLGDGSSGLEFVLQGMLTAALGGAAPTLVTPVSPAWAPPANAVRPKRGEMLWANMSALVDQIGWLLRFRWNGNTPELRLFAPVRTPTALDVAFSVAASEVRALEAASFDLAPVRNLVQVLYRSGGTPFTVTAENAASQTLYGLRRLIVSEDSASQIRTAAQAQRMADAIVADLGTPPLAYRLTHVHCFWPVEVGDVLDIAPDGVAFDATQRLGVVSVEHQLEEGGGRTVIGLRGTPASRGRSWLTVGGPAGALAGETTSASASFTSAGAVRVNVIGPADANAVRAAVSTVGPPTEAEVDAATGSLSAASSMAALTSPDTFPVGTTVFVAARAYVAGVGGRVIQLVVVRDAAAGNVAVGPDLEVRLALDATQGTITYVADGTVELSEDGGAYAAAPASPFVRARAAQGSDTVKTLTLRATLNGQSISNTVVIPARATVDTDTVAPDLRLIRDAGAGGDAAAFVAFAVQVSNPKAGGPTPTVTATWTGTVVDRFNGLGWTTMTSGASLLAGDLLRMTRPANGATPGSFTARATIAGGGAEEITVTIPQRAVDLPPAVVCRVVSSNATQVTVEVVTQPGGGTVRRTGGNATVVAGPALNTDQPSGTQWTFSRPAFQSGAAFAEFRGTVSGVSDDDTITIEEQGRDTVAILTRLRVIGIGATTYTVRYSAWAPFNAGQVAGWEVTQMNNVTMSGSGGAVTEGQTGGIVLGASDGDLSGGASTGYFDFVVTRPAIGGQPGRVTIRTDRSGLTSDADSVDIEPQRPLVPGRIDVVGIVQSGADATLRWRAWAANGAERTATGAVELLITQTPTSGAPVDTAPTVTRDAVNGWFTATFARTPGSDVRARITALEDVGSGTRVAQVTVPVPTWLTVADTGGDAFSSVALTPNVGANTFTLSYVLGAAFAGAAVTVYLDSRDGGDGRPNPPGFAPGDYGEVSLPGNPTGRALVGGGGPNDKLYLMRARLEAVIGGRVVGTGVSPSALFYLDNSGT